MNYKVIPFLFLLSTLLSCSTQNENKTPLKAFVGATIIDGTGATAIKNAVLIVDGKEIVAVGSADEIALPEGTEVMEVSGKTIMPGLINAHGHIGATEGLDGNRYSKANVLRDLKLNARYGITTVNSLGGDEQPSADFRHEQDTLILDRSRIFIAGDVVTGNTPEEARAVVDKNAAMGVDVIKIRVDDNLGTTPKMTPEIYEAVIDQAKKYNLPVVAHIFYLDDAKALLKLGVQFIAHSVRDKVVDDEFIRLMKENNAYYCPTLMREVSTFVYESTPDYFSDPYFLKEADTSVIAKLKDPVRQQKVRESVAAQKYKEALAIAKQNLKILQDQGVTITFGTDTGPPARFEGYFEHLELEQMVDAGLTPMQAIKAATRNAAASIRQNNMGTLAPGNAADFLILSKNPLEDIRNTRTIESVWIGGNKLSEN